MSVMMVDDAVQWLSDIKASYGENVTIQDTEKAGQCIDLLRMLEVQIDANRTANEAITAMLQAKVQKLQNAKLLYMHLASALFKELLTNEAEQTD